MFNNQVAILTPEKYLNRSDISLLSPALGVDRDSLLIKLAFLSGGRELELTRLTKSDITLSPATVTYSDPAKNSNPRTVSIPEDLARLLLQLPTDRLFPVCTRRVRAIWFTKRPAALKKCFKSLRHTFGVELYRSSHDILFVQRAMGHKSLSNTLIYAVCVDYEESMQKNHSALDALLRPA